MADLSLNFSSSVAGTNAYGDVLMQGGDLVLTSDSPRSVGGTNPITQSAAQKCRTLLGEFFLDTTLGVPYFQDLLGQRADLSRFEAALQSVILSTPGILTLTYWKLTTDRARRVATLVFRAQTTTGEVLWSGPLDPQAGSTS